MMWWAWLLVFLLILAAGGWWIWQRARATWRSAKALSVAASELGASTSVLEKAAERPPLDPPRLAVFEHPETMYRERTATRATVETERRTRREANLPPWARR